MHLYMREDGSIEAAYLLGPLAGLAIAGHQLRQQLGALQNMPRTLRSEHTEKEDRTRGKDNSSFVACITCFKALAKV